MNNRMIPLDRHRVLEALGGDPDLFRDVISILLRELPEHMIKLQKALESGDAEAVEQFAHSIKGEVGYLSLAELTRSASQLEASGRERDLSQAPRLYASLQTEISQVLLVCAEWLRP